MSLSDQKGCHGNPVAPTLSTRVRQVAWDRLFDRSFGKVDARVYKLLRDTYELMGKRSTVCVTFLHKKRWNDGWWRLSAWSVVVLIKKVMLSYSSQVSNYLRHIHRERDMWVWMIVFICIFKYKSYWKCMIYIHGHFFSVKTLIDYRQVPIHKKNFFSFLYQIHYARQWQNIHSSLIEWFPSTQNI